MDLKQAGRLQQAMSRLVDDLSDTYLVVGAYNHRPLKGIVEVYLHAVVDRPDWVSQGRAHLESLGYVIGYCAPDENILIVSKEL